jgi:hypothetical protein
LFKVNEEIAEEEVPQKEYLSYEEIFKLYNNRFVIDKNGMELLVKNGKFQFPSDENAINNLKKNYPKYKKVVRINNISAEDIYRDMGVFFVEIDAETNSILRPNLEGVEGFDAEKWNSLYLRALYRPTLLDQKTQIMLILCGITLLLLIFTLFFTYQVNKKVELINNNVVMLKMFIQNNTIASIL